MKRPKPTRRKPARPDTRGIKKPGAAFEQAFRKLLAMQRQGVLPCSLGPLPVEEIPAPHRIVRKAGRA
jgi:hypothetical protein